MAKTNSKTRSRLKPDPQQATPVERISQIVQQWFLAEPLLFGAWSSHQVESNEQIKTIRVGRGRVEFNPDFLRSLDQRTLREVMKFETLRIILKHPYERRKPNLEHALTASNLSIAECINTLLPLPSAESTFSSPDHNHKYFEYYYNLLAGLKKRTDQDDFITQNERTGDLVESDDMPEIDSEKGECECGGC